MLIALTSFMFFFIIKYLLTNYNLIISLLFKSKLYFPVVSSVVESLLNTSKITLSSSKYWALILYISGLNISLNFVSTAFPSSALYIFNLLNPFWPLKFTAKLSSSLENIKSLFLNY